MEPRRTHSLLFVGLGNPGSQYEMTRHNMGFLVLKEFAKKQGWVLKQDRRFNALTVKGIIEEVEVHLLLPMTYMNLSGTAVKRYLDYYKFPLTRLFVVTDDVALPFGQFRLRSSGSAGGHNGLKNIEALLGTSDYSRVRIGVGYPGEKVLADYVLERFSSSEQQDLQKVINRGVSVLERLLKESLSQVMNAVNVTSSPPISGEKGKIDLTKLPLEG